MTFAGIAAKLAFGLTTFAVILTIVMQAVNAPSFNNIATAGGFGVVFTFLYKMSVNIKTIGAGVLQLNNSMLIYRIEHEMVMEYWSKQTGQQRPSDALAKAKGVGL